jgi:CheY-like chemotaxis protein
LVIDDEPMVRSAVGRVLADEGYAVDFAGDGAAALLRLRESPPDAILLDLMMPGMNGRQFLHALRNELGSAVPVVVMTAVHGLGQRAISLGATDVVEKPFNTEELLNKMALAVFRNRSEPRARAGHTADPDRAPTSAAAGEDDLGVVVLVDRDLAALARLDGRLTGQGFSVVAMPSVPNGAPRLFRALSPSAIMIAAEVTSDGGAMLSTTVRSTPGLGDVPLIVYTRDETTALPALDARAVVALTRPSDDDLLRIVELMSGRPLPRVIEPTL